MRDQSIDKQSLFLSLVLNKSLRLIQRSPESWLRKRRLSQLFDLEYHSFKGYPLRICLDANNASQYLRGQRVSISFTPIISNTDNTLSISENILSTTDCAKQYQICGLHISIKVFVKYGGWYDIKGVHGMLISIPHYHAVSPLVGYYLEQPALRTVLNSSNPDCTVE